jgi:hypothetical protein
MGKVYYLCQKQREMAAKDQSYQVDVLALNARPGDESFRDSDGVKVKMVAPSKHLSDQEHFASHYRCSHSLRCHCVCAAY